MKLELDNKDTITLTRVIFNEFQTLRHLEAEGSEEYGVCSAVLKFLLCAPNLTIDDNLPF